MAEPSTTVQPAAGSESPANQPAPTAQATPAPAAGEDLASVKAQLARLEAHKQAQDADLKKYRDREKEREEAAKTERAALESKLKEQGDFAKLYDTEKEKRAALEAQIASLAPRAEQFSAFEARAKDEIAKAKEAGGLPDYLVSAVDSVDAVRGLDILNKYRAAQATAPPPGKTPAPPAPAQGAAPPSPPQPNGLRSIADLQRLKTEDPDAFRRTVLGSQPTAVQRIGARLTGVGRK